MQADAGDPAVLHLAHGRQRYGTRPSACSHGTPYTCGTSLPLMIHGARWVTPGRYAHFAEAVDIAPTLAHLLDSCPPSASEGKVPTTGPCRSAIARACDRGSLHGSLTLSPHS
jgi:hypothetical protein